MSEAKQVTVPLALRLKASLVGGVIGALNPMILSFKQFVVAPEFAAKAHLVSTGGFIGIWLIFPCLLATYLAYPSLYRTIMYCLDNRERARPFVWGIKFGYLATAFAVVFVAFEFAIAGSIESPEGLLTFLLLALAGIVYIGIVALFYTPIILISGYLYALANYHIIKKYYHPNVEAKS